MCGVFVLGVVCLRGTNLVLFWSLPIFRLFFFPLRSFCLQSGILLLLLLISTHNVCVCVFSFFSLHNSLHFHSKSFLAYVLIIRYICIFLHCLRVIQTSKHNISLIIISYIFTAYVSIYVYIPSVFVSLSLSIFPHSIRKQYHCSHFVFVHYLGAMFFVFRT